MKATRARSKIRAWFRFLPTAIVLIGLVGHDSAAAADIFVTSLADKVNDHGGCSLKEAILSANGDTNFIFTSPTTGFFTGCVAGSGDDTIILPASQVIFLSRIFDDPDNPFGPTATPMIVSRITIEMNGTRLEWTGQQHARAFAVASSGDLTINDAYIKGFVAKGGDGGNGSTFDPFASGSPLDIGGGGGGGMGAGGAIYVKGSGSLTVSRSTFEGNLAIGGNGGHHRTSSNAGGPGGGGGGMGGNGGGAGGPVNGALSGGGGGGARGNGGRSGGGLGAGSGGGGTLTDGQIGGTAGERQGGAGGYACGGAGGDQGALINADGHDAVCAGGGGGGAGEFGPDEIAFVSHANGGKGAYGGGGGGASASFATVGATMNGGDGGFGGGGGGGTSSFSSQGGAGGFGGGGGGSVGGNNSPAGFFGGAGFGASGGGGAGLGGAIFNDGGTISVVNSTFTANRSVGGVKGEFGANGADAGGAVFSLHGTLTVRYSTISGNTSGNGTGLNGGITVFQLPAPQPIPTSFTLQNTIVTNNGTRDCLVFGLSPTVAGSGNLILDNNGCPGGSDADPLLAPLAYNGGLTPTMAIADGSPALDTADPSIVELRDQRGARRPEGNGYDVGAFEMCVFNPKFDCFGFHEFPFTRHLDTSAFPAVGGAVTPPSGDYTLNSVLPLKATPNAGFAFINWTGNVADPGNPSTFVVMDRDQMVTANFSGCATNLSGRGTAGTTMAPPRVDLTWAPNGADHGNVLRSSTSGGPYSFVGTSTTTSFTDTTGGLINNTKVYYIVQFFASTNVKICDSSELAVTVPRGR